MSQHQMQENKFKNTREEDFEDLEEIKETFRKGSMSKENKEEILGSTSRNSAIQKGLEKEKHIQVKKILET